MQNMEQLELEAHRSQIVADMNDLRDKYRRIFGWDIPEIDQPEADRLILAAMHTALDSMS